MCVAGRHHLFYVMQGNGFLPGETSCTENTYFKYRRKLLANTVEHSAKLQSVGAARTLNSGRNVRKHFGRILGLFVKSVVQLLHGIPHNLTAFWQENTVTLYIFLVDQTEFKIIVHALLSHL